MTNEQEILWLAGLLEGEGSFRWLSKTPKRKQILAQIYLKMTDEDVVRHAANIMGVSYHPVKMTNPTWKPAFYCQVFGQSATAIMRQILPFMGQRRSAKIEECLDEYARRRTKSEAQTQKWAKRKRCKSTGSLFAIEKEIA